MQIPVLIEPLKNGQFRAKAGEPFVESADAPTAQEAVQLLEEALRARLSDGGRLEVIELPNGTEACSSGKLELEPLPDDDWFFQTMREVIAENRRREDEAEG
jgi:hypothetical protein